MSQKERIESFRQEYVHSKPAICFKRSEIWTESHKNSEGQPVAIRRAKAFRDTCAKLPVTIFPNELIVGSAGQSRRSGILTPEFSWKWVDQEMDTFETRPQDPYFITEEQRQFIRGQIFPYWEGKSLEEAFLSRIPEDTAKILIDTGIIDNDSKWRQAVGEITPDYQDRLFPLGFIGIAAEAKEKLAGLEPLSAEALDQMEFYRSVILAAEGIMLLAERYADHAEAQAASEEEPQRKGELLEIARVCRKVPGSPPETFAEAIQFVWFVQLGGILSENPLALNLGRFDQYMFPYYAADISRGTATQGQCQELIEALWIKLSEWVWTISANTADFFAGYNQFQNLTVGGRKRDGSDGTNALSYMCLQATASVKTHQPGLSVRIHPDSPEAFFTEVVKLVRTGTGFPAIHSDEAGAKMLMQAGYEPEDARDWSNCGCVVPHFRKTGQWTAAVNVNFGAALEYALNAGKSRFTGNTLGIPMRPLTAYQNYDELESAFKVQLAYLVKHSVIGTVIAQQLHREMVPRPFLSACVDGCMDKGKDLSKGGAKYNVGPVLTGIGIGVAANSLAAIKQLVFEQGAASLSDFEQALEADWVGWEALQEQVMNAPKYGNDNDYVDQIARDISRFYYHETRQYTDIFGSHFNTAFMGISNYIPAGKVVGATPCGRKSRMPLSEGVSPFVGSDTGTPLMAMRSAAKLNHDLHTGGTLLNLRVTPDLLETSRGIANFKAMIAGYFSLGAFHVQFNCISTEVLRKAQENPMAYRDLLVRVAGYSTQFVNLSREVQEAVIARTAHNAL